MALSAGGNSVIPRSLPQMPHLPILMTTWSDFGTGSGRSSMLSFWLAALKAAARISYPVPATD
jgi:hypothetical protein